MKQAFFVDHIVGLCVSVTGVIHTVQMPAHNVS